MRTVVEVLRDNAQHTDRSVTFMRVGGDERVVSYPALWEQAQARGRALLAQGLTKGDRVALVLPEPDEFVLTFLAALTAGLVAVPVYPPQTMAKLEAYGDTLQHVLAASEAKLLVTSGNLAEQFPLQQVVDNAGCGAKLLLESEIATESAQARHAAVALPDVTLDDLAFLQFTSGSTSRPKGVMVTFGNLAANAKAIMFDGLRSTPEDKGVSWLPLYHDMGLIGFVVAPLYALVQVMFLPTTAFIRRPSLWLDAIHRFRGTITFAPNFAYALATRAITERQSSTWDLSCMRALGCGAEPIQADVLRGFLDRFAPQGLSPTSVLPSYGMAEATLAVSFHNLGTPLHAERVDLDAMKRGEAKGVSNGDSLELVSCGQAFPDHEIKIADGQGVRLPERRVGEIWLRGPSVTKGYFKNPEATEEAFHEGWLKTGDLGFFADDNLYICGRAKDLIILNGKNYYPQDIERIVSTIRGIRDGQCVAFSYIDKNGAEHAIVVAESRRSAASSPDVVNGIIQAVRSELGVTLSEVVLIKRGTLPKTSSGKVRRREAKRRLEEGLLELASDDGADSLFPPPRSEGAAPPSSSVDRGTTPA